MTRDFDIIQAACSVFGQQLAGINDRLSEIGVAELERLLELHVALLASRLGWDHGVRVRLAKPQDGKYAAPSAIRQYFCSFGHSSERTLDFVVDPEQILPAIATGILMRLPVLVWLFGSVFERMSASSAEYPCALGDGSFQELVAFSATHRDACRVPDYVFFSTEGHRDFKEAITRDYPAWETRTPKVFWRGSSSGLKRYWPPAGPEDVSWLPRVEFCARARALRCAERLDVGIIGWVQIPDREASLSLLPSGLLTEPVPRKAFARFKAVIDIGGNSDSWTHGLFLSLLGGSCVVRIESERGFSQWYHDRLLPWVHYVPVRSDLSDLEAAVDWIFANDAGAREIGEAGCAFAKALDFQTELTATVARLIAWKETH
jgi:hypothetical protein